jgi:regulator of protease activity HflC (stomatin/prohibitin superfamily)
MSQQQYQEPKVNIRKTVIGIVLTVVAIVFISCMGKIFEEVDAGEVVVIQHLDGALDVYDQPTSFAWQGFGKCTHYRRSNQFEFYLPESKGDADNSIAIGFNDGGYGRISGSVRYDLPTDKQSILRIHTHFGSQASVEAHLIKTNIEKAAFASGPLMSSRESFAEKKNDLIFYIEDQASRGAYKTQQVEKEEVDPLSNAKKTVTRVQILKDSSGVALRQEVSPIVTENIHLYNLSIKVIDYDANVKAQIAKQQTAIMQVQTSIAEAKTAEQKAITIEKEGEADAAKAKWEQEVLKAETVTKAQADSAVASLQVKTAALNKQRDILQGEGEAEKKKLAMQANGALEQKLDAWVKVQGFWANAFGQYQGSIVPAYQSIGSGAGGASNDAFKQFMEMNMMSTAKALNLSVDANSKK